MSALITIQVHGPAALNGEAAAISGEPPSLVAAPGPTVDQRLAEIESAVGLLLDRGTAALIATPLADRLTALDHKLSDIGERLERVPTLTRLSELQDTVADVLLRVAAVQKHTAPLKPGEGTEARLLSLDFADFRAAIFPTLDRIEAAIAGIPRIERWIDSLVAVAMPSASAFAASNEAEKMDTAVEPALLAAVLEAVALSARGAPGHAIADGAAPEAAAEPEAATAAPAGQETATLIPPTANAEAEIIEPPPVAGSSVGEPALDPRNVAAGVEIAIEGLGDQDDDEADAAIAQARLAEIEAGAQIIRGSELAARLDAMADDEGEPSYFVLERITDGIRTGEFFMGSFGDGGLPKTTPYPAFAQRWAEADRARDWLADEARRMRGFAVEKVAGLPPKEAEIMRDPMPGPGDPEPPEPIAREPAPKLAPPGLPKAQPQPSPKSWDRAPTKRPAAAVVSEVAAGFVLRKFVSGKASELFWNGSIKNDKPVTCFAESAKAFPTKESAADAIRFNTILARDYRVVPVGEAV